MKTKRTLKSWPTEETQAATEGESVRLRAIHRARDEARHVTFEQQPNIVSLNFEKQTEILNRENHFTLPQMLYN